MSEPRPRLACILALIGFGLACGPIPGGRLGGIETSVPADWSPFLEDGRTLCEIESRPADPHSIQLDCFLFDGKVHVQSHRWALSTWWPVESWAAIWIQHPEVRLRIGEQIFEVEAELVSTPVERIPVLEFRGYDPVPDGIAVFRFIARKG